MDERFQKLWDALTESIAASHPSGEVRPVLLQTGVSLLAAWRDDIRAQGATFSGSGSTTQSAR
jgi:hypothetical protein